MFKNLKYYSKIMYYLHKYVFKKAIPEMMYYKRGCYPLHY